MFAVPGWSIPADSLKVETAASAIHADDANNGPSNSRKRKRPGGLAVTTGNVADLWERVIEGKQQSRRSRKTKDNSQAEEGGKKPKQNSKQQQGQLTGQDGMFPKAGNSPVPSAGKGEDPPSKKQKKQKQKSKEDKSKSNGVKPQKQPEGKDQKADTGPPAAAETNSNPPPAVPAPPKLTPLQDRMREKLVSGRFRQMNEELYTKPSAESFRLFQKEPERFQLYHEGFRRQVAVWPENPVDGYVALVRQRGRQRSAPRHADPRATPGPGTPLPRTDGICTIADLGCGDAQLAQALQAERKKLKLRLLSYDLQAPGPLVTKADIANLPLADGSVDVAVFCLALMGTNWVDFVEEAYRVLRWHGELWVAEIKSRFAQPRAKKHAVVDHSVGNRKKVGAGKKAKGKDGRPEEVDEADLAVEVDGVEDIKSGTDVSAFVEVLRKRGFVLHGDPDTAIDMNNKMFVKMSFSKAAPATKGKGVAKAKEPKKGFTKSQIPDDKEEVNEGAILKPCVYKLR